MPLARLADSPHEIEQVFSQALYVGLIDQHVDRDIVVNHLFLLHPLELRFYGL